MLTSTRSVIALLSVAATVLAGCGGDNRRPAKTVAGPCEIVSNGTPLPKPPPAPGPPPAGPAAPAPSRDLATTPEIGTGYRTDMTAVRTATYAVATANPLATEAACKVLRDGGTAADALVTAQAVLGLVEPQSSGIGGGGFLLYYDAARNAVRAFDGRETAPAAATENYLRWVSESDRTAPKPDARASGRAIGVPGIVRLLDDTHRQFGKKTWRDLFTPAVSLADRGFDISHGWQQLSTTPTRNSGLTPPPPATSSTPTVARNRSHPDDQPGLRENLGRHRIRGCPGLLHR
ncbi:gamma-glutamyltransferase [Mycolicibacterium conceptionense]|uniref:Gamma-glutamyltransferase n=1 Tax=Mycolicibacterium conceptionense TaxID=451644 RepID=A0A0U1DED6_9MYCO|nr:gamma-glutamyltransferase [Mycolicibacterium conceptionense]